MATLLDTVCLMSNFHKKEAGGGQSHGERIMLAAEGFGNRKCFIESLQRKEATSSSGSDQVDSSTQDDVPTIKIVARRQSLNRCHSDPIVRSFSGVSETDFPPSKVNCRRRRKWERRFALDGRKSDSDPPLKNRTIGSEVVVTTIRGLPSCDYFDRL
ncbi:Ryanodine receptor 2 [Branchiostoma belcheri]|nr:Ryanodine receptor 2 [Branchiostoma belcheri]